MVQTRVACERLLPLHRGVYAVGHARLTRDAHKTRRAFQRDRTRSNDLQAQGWTVLRFTHGDVVHRGEETAARVARMLAQATAGTG